MNRALSEKIKNLRVKAGYDTLGGLYRASGVTVSTLSRIEAGIQRPTPATLRKLAPCLGVSYEYLMVSAGYLPPPGKAVVREEQGGHGTIDIDELLDDENRPLKLGGRVISPEVRQVLKENLNLIKRLITN